jgi:hypothetical protein
MLDFQPRLLKMSSFGLKLKAGKTMFLRRKQSQLN